MVFTAAGCEYKTIRETPVRESVLRRFAAEGKLAVDGGSAQAGERRRARRGYAVLVDTYSGPGRLRDAHETIRRLKEEAGLADLWVVDVDATLWLYHGRFPRDDDPRAAAALERVRAARLGGERAFRDAELRPLGTRESYAAAQALDELDLRRHRDRDLLTLQVAVYNDAFGPDFRRAAEVAARALRDDGEEAYFFHGPHRSMVTLGLFTFEDDFVQRGNQRAYGASILALQREYPYNLVNGMTLIERNSEGQSLGEQESIIVRVP